MAIDHRRYDGNMAVNDRRYNGNMAIDDRRYNGNMAVNDRRYNGNMAVNDRRYNGNMAIDHRRYGKEINMSLKIKDRAKPAVPPVEPGVYMAACVGVIDLGEQYSDKFKNYSAKIMLTFELLGETVEIDGEQKPRQLSKIFAFSTGARSALRKFLGDWDGIELSDEQIKAYDLSQRLGKTCQLQVVLNETGDKANIGAIMGLPKGFKADKPKSEMLLFDLEEFDQATFDKLSEWTQETIRKSSQWQKEHASEDTVAVQADPETGEVVETGDAVAINDRRDTGKDQKGGVPF